MPPLKPPLLGIPSEHKAIGEDWIISGQLAGSIPIWGSVVNELYIARNSRWVNYLWYNQQRFIYYTILALGVIKEQLHAKSVMALQNRFVLERLLAPDQGLCEMVGEEECCSVIPLHTDYEGNLTQVLNKMKVFQNEHVQNSNWRTKSCLYENWGGGVF